MPSRKADLNEFIKWIWGVHGAAPTPEIIGLYQRAVVCRMFPAYRLHELRDTPALEILRALELIDIAQKAQSKG